MRRSWLFLAALLLFPLSAQAGEPVGAVIETRGHATILHEGETTPHDIALNAPVFGHDVIEGGEDAHVTLKFADDTQFVISGKGKLTVDEYVYDAAKPENDKSVFSILGAAFSYVGGKIDKTATPNAKLNLEFGSIGIRGTKVLGAMAQGNNWIYLAEGKATVDNDGGEVILNPGDGTSVSSKTAIPRTPYAFAPEEIDWLQKMVDDPSARSNAAMASAALSADKAHASSAMAANSIAAPTLQMAPPAGGGGAALDRQADMPAKSIEAVPAVPAAPAAEAPAETSAPAAAAAPAAPPAETRSDAKTPAQPAAPAAMPASPPPAARARGAAEPPTEAKAKAKAKAELAGKAASADIIPLSDLTPASIGTRIAQDGAGILRIDAQWPVTINLAAADISAQHLQNAVLHYSAALKAKGLKGTAYLEMWVHFPGMKGGNFFSRNMDTQLTKDGDWQSFETPFFTKPGETPDRVTLNLVINGTGTVWVKDVHLTK